MDRFVKVMTPEGERNYRFYFNNHELAKDYTDGVIHDLDELLYKDRICSVIGDFVDEDGELYLEMLEVACLRMGPII